MFQSYMGCGKSKKLAKASAAAEVLQKKFNVKVSLPEKKGFVSMTLFDDSDYAHLVPIPQDFADKIGE